MDEQLANGGDDATARERFEHWAILELMGHRKMAGLVSEVEVFGRSLLRIDRPDGDRTVTQLYGPQAIYSLTPVSEEVARLYAKGCDPAPVTPWEIRQPALPFSTDDPDEVDEAEYA